MIIIMFARLVVALAQIGINSRDTIIIEMVEREGAGFMVLPVVDNGWENNLHLFVLLVERETFLPIIIYALCI